jgi:hypothetical protein
MELTLQQVKTLYEVCIHIQMAEAIIWEAKNEIEDARKKFISLISELEAQKK